MIAKIFKFTALAALILGFILLSGCGDDITSTNGGGSGTTYERIVAFSSSPSDIPYGSESTISGSVVDSSGEGLEGIQVILSVLPVEAGYFLPAAVETGSGGSFEARFIPVDTGSVEIWATTVNQSTANFSASIVTGENYQIGQWHFDFTSTPSFTLADGQDVSSISVDIQDPDGEPIANGVEVRLEAGERFTDVDGDGYFTENVDDVTVDINNNGIWDRVGTVPRTAVASDGQISFNYTAGTLSGLIYIRATIVETDGSSSGEFPMVLRPSDEVAAIDLTTNRQQIQVKATGGIEFANFTAVCYDAYGNRVQSELPIKFYIVYAPGGGERFTVTEYDSTTTPEDTIIAVTNVVGEATCVFFSGIKSGTAMLQARFGDIFSNATLININAGPPAHITVGVNPCNIRGWDVVNAQSEIVVVVNDKYGNPVADTTEVYFWTDEGTVIASSYTQDGIAASTFIASDPRDDGIAIIGAETAGGTVADSSALIVSGPAATVTAYGYSTEMNADGEDYTDIWVDGRDINGNFMVDGTGVQILLSDGAILSGSLANGCYSSLARIRYKSSTLTRDYVYSVPDNGIGRILTGSVQIGGVMGPTTGISITMHTGPANVDRSEVKVSSTAAPGSSEPVNVLIKDRAGNPLGGHLISSSASMGTITPASATTNAYGEVSFVYTAPGAIGNVYITLEDDDPGYGGIIITKKIKIDITD